MSNRINSLASLKDLTRRKVEKFLMLAKEAGLDIFVRESLRTQDRQNMLYGKGRSKSELRMAGVPDYYADPYASKVTWTLNSRHLSGQAVDIVFDMDSDPKVQQPTWTGNYNLLITIGKECGLRNLAPTELCHFEDDGTPLLSAKELKTRAKDLTIAENSLSNVWKWLDTPHQNNASELANYIRQIK